MKMTREYIVKEGLLEVYFLGELSSEQEQQVFEDLQSDPELKKQYKDLEKSMELLEKDRRFRDIFDTFAYAEGIPMETDEKRMEQSLKDYSQ